MQTPWSSIKNTTWHVAGSPTLAWTTCELAHGILMLWTRKADAATSAKASDMQHVCDHSKGCCLFNRLLLLAVSAAEPADGRSDLLLPCTLSELRLLVSVLSRVSILALYITQLCVWHLKQDICAN